MDDSTAPRARARIAWAIAIVTFALAAATVLLYVMDPSAVGATSTDAANGGTSWGTGGLSGFFVFLLPFLAFPVVGLLVATRRPGNKIGWILLATGLLWQLSNFGSSYGEYAAAHPGSLPAGAYIGTPGSWAWIPTLGLLGTFTILLFPDGRLPSPRWRWVGRLAAVSIAVLTFAAFVYPSGPAAAPNPFALPGAKPLLDALQTTIFLLILAIVLSLVSIVVRYRRGDRERREQLRWLMFAAGALVALYGVGNAAIELIAPIHAGAATPLWQQVYQDVTTISYALIPTAIGFAVLKYRLYDIDVVISKTVQYGALALFIALMYTAVVVGVGNLLGARSANLGLSIAATALVALAFDPVRRRVQRFANRLVYGERATPYEVLARFSERVGGTFATDDVLPRTARVLAEGVGAARATVWLQIGPELRPQASWPPGADVPVDPVTFDDGDLSAALGADLAVPVRSSDERLGALAVTKERGAALTPEDVKLLDDLAAQAGLVLENVRLSDDLEARLALIGRQAQELRASRQRIVSAQDAERRRLERNIHDGAQQHLVALAVKLRLARGLLEKDPERARAMLDELSTQVDDARETLRTLALGIYPPQLEANGIAAALAAQYERSTLPVHLAAQGLGRYPLETEAAIYFCVLEALQNAAKYAGATSVDVRLREDLDALTFEVIDDGVGFDAGANADGTGLAGMRDRLEVLGGSASLDSAPGRGTRVRGSVPLARTAVTA